MVFLEYVKINLKISIDNKNYVGYFFSFINGYLLDSRLYKTNLIHVITSKEEEKKINSYMNYDSLHIDNYIYFSPYILKYIDEKSLYNVLKEQLYPNIPKLDCNNLWYQIEELQRLKKLYINRLEESRIKRIKKMKNNK